MSPVILVHGGAGRCPPGREAAAREGCRRAAERAWLRLQDGAGALEAVELAITALEDDPQFNAGTGAALDAAGAAQLDASLMEGWSRRAGAVACLRRQRNPIRVARHLLEDGRHVLLVAEGAEAYALEAGFAPIPNDALIVAEQRRLWEQEHGTVGAVALDARGRLAAGTSTGGQRNALPGRVGDSPLIGCGTWADSQAAVSCTGIGEAIIRCALARDAAWRWERDGEAGAAAAVAELEQLTQAEAGLILLDCRGHSSRPHNAPHMATCRIDAGGVQTAI